MKLKDSKEFLSFITKKNEKYSISDYEKFIFGNNSVIVEPLKVMALLVAVAGIFAMIFEVRFFSAHSLDIYFARLTSTLIAFIVLVILSSKKIKTNSIWLVHLLLLSIIISSGYIIFLIPDTLIINSQITALIIFTSALFLSWGVKNQIIAAIYYNVVFAAAIIMNDHSIYFLPNLFETVLFVMFLTSLSVAASAINFKYRLQLAAKSYEIKMSEQKFHSIFDNSVDGIFQSSLKGKFLTVNKAMVKLLGYDNENEMMELDISKDVYTNSDERLKLLRELKEKGEIRNYKVALKKKNGSSIIVRINDRIVTDEDNNQLYFEGSIQDITHEVLEEKRRIAAENALFKEKEKANLLAADAQRANTTKSRFLANMSHEIRTPLNGIIGYLTLIEMDAYENKEEMKSFMTNAKQSAEALLVIINDILDLSKIESGKIDLELTDFNLDEILEQSISILLTKAKEKSTTIEKVISTNTPVLLKGDQTRVRQIFLNLLSNAIKFTENGKVSVTVDCIERKQDTATLNVKVADTGIGIPKDKLDSIFKPFTQAEQSHTRKFGGTGLGLVISKEFIGMMGGNINVTSEPGVGTTFNFTINIKVQDSVVDQTEFVMINRVYEMKTEPNLNNGSYPDQEQDVQEEIIYEPQTDIKKIRKGYKILLAEDNLINQKIAVKMISGAGYNVEAVDNGKKVLDSIQNCKFDLILMDVQMPELDGFETTSEVRALKGRNGKIPIIALTAHALPGDRERCIKAGMNGYATKPIDPVKLVKEIDELIISNDNRDNHNEGNGNNGNNGNNGLNNGSVFDFDHLGKVSMGNKEFEKEILMTFIDDIAKRCLKLESLISEKDFKDLISEAHTIKGASYSIGATMLGDEALAIELSSKHNDLDNVRERMEELKSIFEKTKYLLNGYLS